MRESVPESLADPWKAEAQGPVGKRPMYKYLLVVWNQGLPDANDAAPAELPKQDVISLCTARPYPSSYDPVSRPALWTEREPAERPSSGPCAATCACGNPVLWRCLSSSRPPDCQTHRTVQDYCFLVSGASASSCFSLDHLFLMADRRLGS